MQIKWQITIGAFPRLTFDMPVELSSPEDGTDRIFLVEQKGVIRIFQNSADIEKSTVFLDIDKRVHSGGEAGLLGMAFHPDYKTNGYFYLNYTSGNSKTLETIISRFKVSASNTNIADPESETVLIYGDFVTGNIWALSHLNNTRQEKMN